LEFFTGHDINGDGKNDFYIGRKVKPLNSNDAKALASTFWALFILIAVVLGLTAGANYIFSNFYLILLTKIKYLLKFLILPVLQCLRYL